MSNTVDNKIVQMAFENSDFEKNVNKSLGTIDKLKQSLNFKDAEKSFDGITNAASKVSFGSIGNGLTNIASGFSAMSVVGITALVNLTNAAIQAGTRIAKALVIDPIKTGLNEYETKLNSVQTILANTQKEGTTLEVVTDALNKLNEYSDKTIYNFQQMTRNVGTFTAAGVKLETSVAAIKGIANLAAISGSNAEQASTAMYQLSQALSTGTVKLMDWNSVVNAGMGGQVFQDAIKETARLHGVAIDQMIEEEGSFRDTLQKGWFTSEILTETLAKFTGDLNADQLRTMGYTEDQIASIIKMGQTANDAATKVKTFTQLFDTLKEAAQSGWAQTWEIIIGDFEEAKSFLTDLNSWFGSILGASADARNQLLGGWKDLGGRTALLQSLQNVLNGIVSVINPIRDGMREIFPPITAQQLFNITKGIQDLTEKFKLSAKGSEDLKRIFKGVFGILDIGKMAVLAIAKEFGRLLTNLSPVSGGITDLLVSISDFILKIRDAIKENHLFENVMHTIGDTILLIIGFIKTGITGLVSAIDKFKKLKNTEGFLKAIAESFKTFFSSFKNLDFGIIKGFIDRLVERFKPLAKIGEFLKNAFGGNEEKEVNPFIEKLVIIRNKVMDALKKFALSILDSISKIDFSNFSFDKVFDGLNSGLLAALLFSITRFVTKGTGLFGSIVDIFKGVSGFAENANGILASITTIMTGVKDILTAWQQQIRAGILIKIATAIGILAVSLIALSLVDSEKLTSALASITALFANLMGSMALYEKLAGGTTGIPTMAKGVAAMIGLSTSVLLLSGALVAVSNIETGDIVKGVLTIASLSAILVATSIALSKQSGTMIKGVGSLLIFSIAIRALIGPLKSLGEIDTEGIIKGLAGLGVLLAEVAIFLQAMNFNSGDLEDVVGLLILSGAISTLSYVIKQLGALDQSTLTQGLTVLGVLLAGLSGVTKIATGGGLFILTATGMLILSGAMVILADVIEKLGKLSIDQVAVALTAMGGSLLIFAVALNAMNTAMVGAGALLVAAGAMVILAPALKLLASLSLGQVGIAILAMAAAFTVLGVAASVLTPLLPSLLLLGVALASIGAAALFVGVGVLAFSAALASLAVTGAAGATAVTALLLAISTILPILAVAAATAIIAFAKKIKEGAPIIFDAVSSVMLGFLRAITENIPQVAELILTLIDTFLQKIDEKLPSIVEKGYSILKALLEGARSNVPEITSLSIDIITLFLAGISARLPELVQSGYDVLISFIDGLAAAAETNIPRLEESIRGLGLAVVKGLLKGLFEGQVDLRDGIIEIGQVIVDGFKNFFGIHSPSTVFMELARQLIQGLVLGFKNNISLVTTEVTNLGDKILDGLTTKYNNMLEAGKDLVRGFALGIQSQISEAVSSAAELALSVLSTISDVLNSHSPSRETMELGGFASKGLALGIDKFAHLVTKSTESLADDTLAGFTTIVSTIADAMDSNVDFEPSIRPVVDLSGIESGSKSLQNMLDGQTLNMGITASKAGTIKTSQDANSVDDATSTSTKSSGNITFIQNNNSPKELSRIDIYRNTKNQLLQAKEVVGA